MGTEQRKPLLELDGVPILLHTLGRVSATEGCDEIVLVVHPEDLPFYQREWGSRLEHRFGVTRIVPGGSSRQESVWLGLQASDNNSNLVMVHDAVRPLVQINIIQRVAKMATEHGGAIAAVPSVATIKEVDGDHRIVETPPRDNLWMAQTPQGFHRSVLIEAHRSAERRGMVGTDDAGLVEAIGHEVYVVEDSRENIKITTPEDMAIARTILERQRKREAPGPQVTLPGPDGFPSSQ